MPPWDADDGIRDHNRAVYGVAYPELYEGFVCAADRMDISTDGGGRWTLTINFDMDEAFDDELYVQLNSSLVAEAVKTWAKDVTVRLTDNRDQE